MPKFGAYQTIAEIHRGVLGTVWSARAEKDPADQPPRYAVKTCKPDIDIAGAEQAALAVSLFLEQAELQLRVAKAAPDVFAPVHAVARMTAEDGWGGGSSGGEGGAYSVSNLYPRSLERIISSRVALSSESVAAVCTIVLRAARAMKQHAGRPHADLKPSNILIAGELSTELSPESMFVADPQPQSRLAANADDGVDLRDLGEILYQLVTFAVYRERGGWPVAESAQWTRLANGKKWLALCNRLLDPNTQQGRITLEEVDSALVDIDQSAGTGGKGKLIAAGVVAALLVAGGAAYFLTRPAPLPPGPVTPVLPDAAVTPEMWAALCDDYYDWYPSLSEQLARRSVALGGVRSVKYVELMPELADIIARFNSDAAKKSDPRSIAGSSASQSYSELGKALPASASTREGAQAIAQASAFVESVKRDLLGPASPVVRQLKSASDDWKKNGLDALAHQLDKLHRGISTKNFSIDALDKAVEAGQRVARINALRADIEKLSSTIAANAHDDKALLKFGEWSRAYPAERVADPAAAAGGADPVDALERALASVKETGDTLVRFVTDADQAGKWSQVCYDTFFASKNYQDLLATAKVTHETFSSWRQYAGRVEFAKPDADPRVGALARSVLDEHLRVLDRLGKLDGPEDDLKPIVDLLKEALTHMGAPTDADRAVIVDRVREAVSREWNADLMADCKSALVVVARTDIYKRTVEKIRSASESFEGVILARNGSVEQRIAGLWNDSSQGLNIPSVRAAWMKLRGNRPQAADAGVGPAVSKAEALLKKLQEFERNIPPVDLPSNRDNPLAGVITTAAEAERERLVKAFLDAHPAGPGEWPEGYKQQLAEGFAAYRTQLDEASGLATRLASLLSDAYASAEKSPTGDSIQSVGESLAKLSVYATVKPGLAPLEARVAGLLDIESASDPASLVTMALRPDGNKPEAALAAWRRLGSVRDGKWPATLADLQAERSLITPINALVKNLPASLRPDKESLQRELSESRLARWKRFAGAAATPADIEAGFQPEIVAAASGFGVRPEDLTQDADAPILFRWLVHQFSTGLDALDDEQTRARVGVLSESVKKLPAAVVDAPAVKQFLADVQRESVEDPNAKKPVDFAKLGPGSQGWVCVPGEEGRLLRFTKGDAVLEFIRVETDAGASYVGRTEVSVGQFKAIVDGANAWPDIANLMNPKPGGREDSRRGPRSWIPSAQSQIRIPDEPPRRGEQTDWIGWRANFRSVHPYPLGLRLKEDVPDRRIAAGQEPTLNHPMQYVYPTAALAAAWLAGARLPTSREYKAAVDLDPAAAAPDNTRDQTWKLQLDYQQDVVPYEGSFYPYADDPSVDARTDGVLWFKPVVGNPGAGQFSHLRGNVAEFVFDAPVERTAPPAAGTIASEAVSALGVAQASIFVIGGSALGPPKDYDIGVAIPGVDRVFNVNSPQTGWADVGFRLAFGAQGAALKRPPLATIVRDRLTQFGYGTGK